MFKKLLNLKGTSKISKKEQKTISGGGSRGNCYPFFHLGPCRLDCNCPGTTASQPSGASQFCLLNYPAIIRNATQCGGSGGGIEIDA
ncbi:MULTISPECIES: hypothetical protein [Aquimarina]|uniref:hypothetical protein n=1 Tax=Aquimarina TaxID=290174 RepID=UPI000D68DFBB|nr:MULTISPECIES: hypothetical protein [Aquimarina]